MLNKKGFTLIELLVVIAIISILAAVLLPAISGAQDKAIRTEIKTVISNLESSLKMYQQDHGAYPPSEGQGTEEGSSGYFDGALVRFLDGDTSNDDTGSEITEQYYNFKIEDLRTQDGKLLEENPGENFPVFVSRFETAYFYKNLEGETGRSFGGDKDPREDIINFGHFQIYNQAGDLNKEEPATWITNYRDVSSRQPSLRRKMNESKSWIHSR